MNGVGGIGGGGIQQILSLRQQILDRSSLLKDIHSAAQAPQQWWLLHLRKLAMAEAGLLAAVALRCVPSPYVLISMLLSVLIVVIPTLLIIRARLRSQHSD